MPIVRAIRIASQRLFWPSFEPEPYLEIGDLERLMEKSTTDERFRDVHQTLLRNVVMLGDIQVEEWMRPRSQFPTLQPPVSKKDIQALEAPFNYIFIAEPGSDAVAKSLYLPELIDVPDEHLERLAQPVVYVPWCATIADALEKMRVREREAAIVNEFGETIGILTFEDLLDTILNLQPSRSKIMLDAKPIHILSENEWLVSSVTSLRRLHRFLDVELPESRSVTIAGVVQEKLHRLLQAGDVVGWGPFEIAVIEAPTRGHALLKLTLTEREDEA
jgi:CBS domain containing-hemolysin-like protein